jgi:hypothetical protein
MFFLPLLTAGILVMKFVKGASGVEMVPNLELWKGLPSLIKVCLMVFNTTFNNIYYNLKYIEHVFFTFIKGSVVVVIVW